MPALRLGNSTVSGPLFDMNANDITFGWANMINIENEPGKAISSGLNVRLPSHRYNGHEAPTVSFNSYIDESNIDPTYNKDNQPIITVGWLGSLALVGSGYLSFPIVTRFLGQPADGSVSVVINNVKLSENLQYAKGGSEYIATFNVQLTIVSGPV